MPLPNFDNIRKQVEEILDLPKGSTNPNSKFPLPVEPIEKVMKDIEKFLRRRR